METNTNSLQKCELGGGEERQDRRPWTRRRKLEESHNKHSHTDRDHVPCDALDTKKSPLNSSLNLRSSDPGLQECVALGKGRGGGC